MTIYVVKGSEGEYDSYSEWNIKGFLVKADAEAHVVQLRARQERLGSLKEIGQPITREYYSAKTTAPKFPESMPVPKITKGMKKVQMPAEWHERFRAAEEHNRQVGMAYQEESWAYHERCKENTATVLREAGATEEEIEALGLPWCHGGNDDTSYEIEELEVE